MIALMNDEIGGGAGPTPRSWLERLGLALMGGEAKNRDDLIEELRQARNNGVLDNDTLRMLEGALGVVDQVVADVMVPRGQMVSIHVDQSFEEVLRIAIESGHSRFPVFAEDQEKVIGCLLAKDLLKCVIHAPQSPCLAAENALAPQTTGAPTWQCDIRALLRPINLVPESKRLNQLLKDFRSFRAHMAVVINEYGGIAGLVTIEDVLEEIVGPIDDEHDAEDHPVQYFEPNPDGSVVVQALTPIEEFNARFRTKLSDEEIDTIGGFVVGTLGHLPEIGDSVEIEGLRIVVQNADDRRVHSLRVHLRADA